MRKEDQKGGEREEGRVDTWVAMFLLKVDKIPAERQARVKERGRQTGPRAQPEIVQEHC